MPHVTGDRVKDTTTTTGTGNITVSGSAPTGFRTLSAVATADNDTLFIAIVGGAEWETSLATRVSANVYARTTILESSNANAAVNFAAGTKDVFITVAAADLRRPQFAAGRWYALNNDAQNMAQSNIATSNRIYYTPFELRRPVTLSDLGLYISTLSAGHNVGLAIYASSGTGLPSGTPLAATGNISTAATGFITADITGSNVTLMPGLYYNAVWASHNVARWTTTNQTAGLETSAILVGVVTPSNMAAFAATWGFNYYSDETFNTAAWPNATSETLVIETGGIRGAIIIGLAA